MDDPAVYSRWYETLRFLHEIAPRIAKVHRPTLVRRLLDRSLDLMETITALRYTRRRQALFLRADSEIDRLRVLARLMHDLRLLSTKQYERLSTDLDDVGRMIGGWRRAS